MPRSLTAVLRSPALAGARARARTWAHQHVDRPVTSALKVAAQLRAGRTDVLYLADSTMIHTSPDDRDPRRLGEMFAQETGLRTALYYGPAYPAAAFVELLRLIEPYPRPKAIIVSTPIRTSTQLHVTQHPVFGYSNALRSLRGARRISSLSTKVLRPPASSADYDRFYAIARTSRWSGDRLIGEFRRELHGINPATASDDELRVMWDYFHGEFSDESPGLADWAEVAERVDRLDIPLISYPVHMPYEYGTRLFGQEFVAHVEHNFALVNQALKSGVGDRGLFLELQPPPDSHYIQPKDGTEHWNEHGRLALVQVLKDALADVLG